jgi:hypothetical protein
MLNDKDIKYNAKPLENIATTEEEIFKDTFYPAILV